MNTLPPSTKDIGDRPLSLATHLRATVDLLLDQGRSGYDWSHHASCNAGLLARTMMGGLTKDELSHALLPVVTQHGGVWTGMIRDTCPHLPGERWPDVLQRLWDGGLELNDPSHLEYLNHPDLMDKACYLLDGVECAYRRSEAFDDVLLAYQDPAYVAAYMMRWATRIEAFHAAKIGGASEDALVTSADMERAVEVPIVQDRLGSMVS